MAGNAELERMIGRIVMEDSPSVMAVASMKARHLPSDIRMMQGYRLALIREAGRRLANASPLEKVKA
jgi:hypothetical protein